MPTFTHLALAGAAALILWTAVGLAVVRTIASLQRIGWPLAPVVGWAVHGVLSLPVLMAAGMSQVAVAAVWLGAFALSLLALAVLRAPQPAGPRAIPNWMWIAAAAVAAIPAAAILPKVAGGGIVLAAPLSDHGMVAVIDEIARLGVPPTDPFFGEGGMRLAANYLWQFSAAQLAVLTGANAWEADAALTWFTAFASLLAMAALAQRLAAAATLTAIAVLLFCLTGPLRGLFDSATPGAWLATDVVAFGWLTAAAGAPQHLAAAVCAVLAVYLLTQIRNPDARSLAACVVLAVAALGSSAAVGVVLAVSLVSMTVWLFMVTPVTQRMALVGRLTIAILAGTLLAMPSLYDLLSGIAWRSIVPAGIRPADILGSGVPEAMRPLLNLPAFWIAALPLDLSAVYLIGIAGLIVLTRMPQSPGEAQDLRVALTHIAVAGLLIAWLIGGASSSALPMPLVALPAVLALIVAAAAVTARWLAARQTRALAAVALALLLSLPGGSIVAWQYASAMPNASAQAFAASSVLWDAVRRHTRPEHRIASNPRLLAEMTPRAANLSWALLSGRRSCYAGAALVARYGALAPARLRTVDALFNRVFDGEAEPEDIAELATRYDCRAVVVTARDGAWQRDPFAASEHYRLAETSAQGWRIYVINEVGLAAL